MLIRRLLHQSNYVKHKIGKADMEQLMTSYQCETRRLGLYGGSKFVSQEFMFIYLQYTNIIWPQTCYSYTLIRLFNNQLCLFLIPKCTVEDFTKNSTG